MKKQLFGLLVIAVLTVTVQAAEPRSVLIVADLEKGIALVPEGVEIPPGVVIRGRNHQPLVFTHAPDDKFVAARSALAANSAWGGPVQPFVTREGDTPGHGRITSNQTFRIVPNVVDSDVWTYVYFNDGSYVGSRRWVHDYGAANGGVYYAVQTASYTPSNDYYSGVLYAEQTSSDHPSYNVSATCTINSAGGYCSTGTYGYETPGYFSAHVTSYGNIHHHRLPICGRYGEPPCDENFPATIEVYFP